MKSKYCCEKYLPFLFLFIAAMAHGQDVKFGVSPYFNGTTSINDGIIELGLELKRNDFLLRPSLRLPLTDKKNGLVRVDRYTSDWRVVLPLEFITDPTGAAGPIRRTMFSFQGEWGHNNFKYYPTGSKAEERREQGNSFAAETKLVFFRTAGLSKARQYSPQFRLRYSNEWKAAEEVGVVGTPNGNNITTITNFVVDRPARSARFSPAAAFNYYPGNGHFSYTPAGYYDFIGGENSPDPFTNSQRLRLEGWIFFYPLVKDTPNIKIGVAPFWSIRTKGTDPFERVELGGQITLKVGTTFLQFF